MKRQIICGLILLIALPVFASDIEERLAEAERCYREGMDLLASDSDEADRLLEKSEGLYRRIAEIYPNASVYLCMGNAAFLRKDFPRAVYYYREAQSFRDSAEIREALNAARGHLNERIEIPLQVRIFENVFFFHFRIPAGIRLVTLYLFFAVAALTGAGAVYKGGAGRRTLTVLTAAVILFTCNLISVGITVAESVKYRDGVLLSETEGRSGDHPVYETVYLRPIPAGSEVTVLESRPGWYRVRLRDRSKCWVLRESLSVIGETP